MNRTMGKIIAFALLISCMLCCFVSCQGDEKSSSSNKTVSTESSQIVSEDKVTPSSQALSSRAPSSQAPSSQAPSSTESLLSSKEPLYVEDNYGLRVMSYNILHPNWCSTESYVSITGRHTIVRDIVLEFMPDVIGLQETMSEWHSALNSVLCRDGSYKFACQRNNAGGYNMTTFLYNTKTVKLIDEYLVDLDSNSDIRVLSVAVFERVADGRQFVVTNTHPAPPKSQAAAYERHFKILPDLLKKEMKKYPNLPFIMTGDFNTTEQSDKYTLLMSAVGVKDSKYAAETLVKNYCTFAGFRKLAQQGNSYCIDHIFVNDKVSVKQFDAIIDRNVENASDHIPIYTDIKFK